ncbi:UNVERIFIED_CONTAM: hypothetical protein RMT77_003273 [Armadillidium vulgare]
MLKKMESIMNYEMDSSKNISLLFSSPEIKDGDDLGLKLLGQFDNISSTIQPNKFFYVERSIFVEIISVFVIIVGILGNGLCICIFRCEKKDKKPMVLDKLLTYLCFTGVFTSAITSPFHLYASTTNAFPADNSLCQIQGLLLNLMCLLSLWYTSVMASERFVRIISPHEHRLTFSTLNLNVILAGVFVLLIVEVSGPIYGWAEYGFLNECTACLLNPKANHILTYSVIYVTCYVTLPVLATFGFSIYVILCGLRRNQRLLNGSQILKSSRGIIVVCIAMMTTTLLLLPYNSTLLLQAMNLPITLQQKIVCYWLHIIGITCSYPLIIIVFASNEVLPVFKSFLREKRCCFSWESKSRAVPHKSGGFSPPVNETITPELNCQNTDTNNATVIDRKIEALGSNLHLRPAGPSEANNTNLKDLHQN